MSAGLLNVPITRGFIRACGEWFLFLAENPRSHGGWLMNDQDRSAVAAARRVSAAEAANAAVSASPISEDVIEAAAIKAVQDNLDQSLWDIRLAAILNTMEIARAQGQHKDWTADHAAQIRAMMAIADQTVAGGGQSVVPQGFGPPIRTQIAAAFARAEVAKQRAAKEVTVTGLNIVSMAPTSPVAPPSEEGTGHVA